MVTRCQRSQSIAPAGDLLVAFAVLGHTDWRRPTPANLERSRSYLEAGEAKLLAPHRNNLVSVVEDSDDLVELLDVMLVQLALHCSILPVVGVSSKVKRPFDADMLRDPCMGDRPGRLGSARDIDDRHAISMKCLKHRSDWFVEQVAVSLSPVVRTPMLAQRQCSIDVEDCGPGSGHEHQSRDECGVDGVRNSPSTSVSRSRSTRTIGHRLEAKLDLNFLVDCVQCDD